MLGASVDHGRSRFRGDSELGTIDSNLFVEGTGVRIEQPLANLAPVHLHSTTTYLGVYAADALELFPNLTLTIGARLNIADIELDDQSGGALSGNHLFSHVNPVASLAYSIGPGLTMYGSVSQANRAPTPLELGCADPTRPCLIDGFLISDPPLKQVVSMTYETGLRGAFDFHGEWRWNVGAYRSSNRDDIISVASDISGFGYFLNAATTRRQGIEGGLRLERDRWLVRANYTFVDATFRARLVLSSPDNPAADASGRIYVSPGHRIPGIPAHRFNTGFEYAATDRWTLGADLHVVGSQFLIGDPSNENPELPAYWVVNLHSSYEVWKNLEAFVLVQNLFDERYYVTGTFFETDAISSLSFDDPRSYVPGMPLAAYVGIRGAF